MAEVPEPEEQEESIDVIEEGYFEEEFYVSSEDAGEFLVELGEQLREGNEVTVEGDGWKIPFAFGEPVEIEVQFQGDDPELEFEVELEGGTAEDEAPGVS
jgi:amphi-Trp domain-containing protein